MLFKIKYYSKDEVLKSAEKSATTLEDALKQIQDFKSLAYHTKETEGNKIPISNDWKTLNDILLDGVYVKGKLRGGIPFEKGQIYVDTKAERMYILQNIIPGEEPYGGKTFIKSKGYEFSWVISSANQRVTGLQFEELEFII